MACRITHRIVRLFALPSLLVTVLHVVAGCASYVNIPADGSDTALNAVNLPPVPRVMGRALAFSVNSYPPAGASGADGQVTGMRYYLPDGASAHTYARVGSILGESGIDASIGNLAVHGTSYPDIPRYIVTAVRIRGDDALVDVMLPDTFGPRNLLQIGMQGGLSTWRVIAYSRYIPSLDDAQRAAAYSTPRPVEPDHTQAAEAVQQPTTMPEDSSATATEIVDQGTAVEEVSEDGATDAIPQSQPDTTAEEPLRPVTILTEKTKSDGGDGSTSTEEPVTGSAVQEVRQ